MHIRIGCELTYQSPVPTPMLFIVRPREGERQRRLDEVRRVTPRIPVHEYVDAFGNRVWRLTAPAGEFRLTSDTLVEAPPTPDPWLPDLPGTAVAELPDHVIPYMHPSRYCPSDLLADEVGRLCGEAPEGWARVQAICDWIHANINYAVGSDTATTAHDTFQQRQGVCRDFAHLAVAFCRCLNVPARYCTGYLGDMGETPPFGPMDFAAWFEAYLGGRWYTFDARNNTRRIGRVLIARGRDAADVAITTTFGPNTLESFRVWTDEVTG